MKMIKFVLAAAALLAPLVSHAADFEGSVKMTMTGPEGRQIPATFTLKPGFSRIDMDANGHQVSMIMDHAKNEAIMVMPQQQMYMVHPLDNGMMPSVQEQADKATIEKTNEHEKILGYDTTKYIAKTEQGTAEVWATEQLGTFMGLGSGHSGFGRRPGAPAGHAWEQLFKGKPMFPLRVVSTSANGGQTFKMEVTAIDKHSVADSEFQPPAGYRKFDMGEMMRGGMPGMMPRGANKRD